jgi:hypothetical protein
MTSTPVRGGGPKLLQRLREALRRTTTARGPRRPTSRGCGARSGSTGSGIRGSWGRRKSAGSLRRSRSAGGWAPVAGGAESGGGPRAARPAGRLPARGVHSALRQRAPAARGAGAEGEGPGLCRWRDPRPPGEGGEGSGHGVTRRPGGGAATAPGADAPPAPARSGAGVGEGAVAARSSGRRLGRRGIGCGNTSFRRRDAISIPRATTADTTCTSR